MKQIDGMDCLNVGDIKELLGVGLSKEQIIAHGLVPFAAMKSATYFKAPDINVLIDKLIAQFNAARETL